ncbi:MAG: hypothetical protein NT079_03360 [Candidatus Omnitrophica bacterium]|nr:hypothetical protein [Candidatus Omnitrophota bacterium]
MNQQFDTVLDTICHSDPRYKREAYEFVMEALNYTQKRFRRSKHVTGEELLVGIRQLLQRKFGLMALTVLDHWGVKSTEDFGHLVFNLVSHKILSKTEEDTIESFRNGYDFREVFDIGYRKRFHRQISRMRNF